MSPIRRCGASASLHGFFITAGDDPDARLFVWFAGHGHTIKNGDGDDEGYIVPRDAPSPLVSDTGFPAEGHLAARASANICARRAPSMCWRCSNSCFGGSVFNVARALPPAAITHATALPVRQFISSGDADQEVGDDGTFRRLFIDALQGAEPAADINKDGYLTWNGARAVPLQQDDEPDRAAADAALRQAQCAGLRPGDSVSGRRVGGACG